MAVNKQAAERITIPESEWPMHEWAASDIVVAGIVMALEGCSADDDKTRVAVVDEYGQEIGVILGVRVRPGSNRSVLEIVTDTGGIPAAGKPAVDVPKPRAGAMTVTGTVTSVPRFTTHDHTKYLTVYVDGRPVKYRQADLEVPCRGDQVEIVGVPVIGDPYANMDSVDVRVLG